MEISFIQPSRNNLKYLKWSYESIRKNQGKHIVEICVADDNSNDGTWEWCQQIMSNDPNFKAIRNESGDRIGHTILYDTLVNDVSTNDIAIIFHADMYLAPKALDAIEKHIKKGTIVSLTRIEPPLHPDGVEKVLNGFGIETEEFDEKSFLKFNTKLIKEYKGKVTEGIFAPWAFYKEDFQNINGHDPLYKPQSKEDSDIFDRFQLNGVKFIQTWDGYVYHMTCRGSRFNPTITNVGTESDEWLKQNQKSTRNFIRKWSRMVTHDEYMKPIIYPRYRKLLNINNLNLMNDTQIQDYLHLLEPWFDYINVDNNIVNEYINKRQLETDFDLNAKFNTTETSDINITIDVGTFTKEDYSYITMLSAIIQDSGVIGESIIGNLKLDIKSMTDYNKELIIRK